VLAEPDRGSGRQAREYLLQSHSLQFRGKNQALMRAKVKAIAKQVMKPKRTHDFRTRITLTPYSLSYETKRARLATSETVLFHFASTE
jgi:hypothetical protein